MGTHPRNMAESVFDANNDGKLTSRRDVSLSQRIATRRAEQQKRRDEARVSAARAFNLPMHLLPGSMVERQLDSLNALDFKRKMSERLARNDERLARNDGDDTARRHEKAKQRMEEEQEACGMESNSHARLSLLTLRTLLTLSTHFESSSSHPPCTADFEHARRYLSSRHAARRRRRPSHSAMSWQRSLKQSGERR